MIRPSSLNSSETVDTTRSSDLLFSRDFSDTAIGSSVGTELSSSQHLERQICDLQNRNHKLVELEQKKVQILKEIQSYPFESDKKRLEAERMLLLTNLKTKLLLWEFRQKHQSEQTNDFCDVGSVTVRNLKVHCSESTKFKQYFLCTLMCNSALFLSQICEPDAEGVVNFNITHTFLNLPPDFKIYVRLYVFKIPKQTFHKRIWKKFSCFSTGVITKENRWNRESMFKFWNETTINIFSANGNSEVFLELNDSKLSKLVFEVGVKVDVAAFSCRGWMDVSKNGLFWHQRWCELNGTSLKCSDNPHATFDGNTVNVIDLNLCSSVKIAGPYEQSRTKVMVLEMHNDSLYPFSFYLATNSNNEFDKWKILEKLIPTLHSWKTAVQ